MTTRDTNKVANKICADTWVRQDQLSHHKRLAKTKSSIDTSAPPVYAHLINRSKKEQMLEERYTRIEHENRLLLKKMSRIMRQSSLDNLNPNRGGSLNSGLRKRELKKIMDENQAILRRIQDRKPFYHHQDFENHAQTHAGYMRNIKEKQVRLLPTLLNDPRSKTAPERSAEMRGRATLDPLSPSNAARQKPKKTRALTLKPAPERRVKAAGKAKDGAKDGAKGGAKGKGKKGKKADDKKISKGGFNIGGLYVIVTVEEHNTGSEHFLKFATYDMDSGETKVVEVTFDVLASCIEQAVLAGDKALLSDAVVPRLSFGADGALVFDSSKDWKPATPSEESTAEAPAATEPATTDAAPADAATTDDDYADEEEYADDAEPSAAEPSAEPSTVQLVMKLKLEAVEEPVEVSVHLFIGEKFISKTEAKTISEAGEHAFETPFDLESSASQKLTVKVEGKDATGEFSLEDLKEGETTSVPMSTAGVVLLLDKSTVKAHDSIDLDA